MIAVRDFFDLGLDLLGLQQFAHPLGKPVALRDVALGVQQQKRRAARANVPEGDRAVVRLGPCSQHGVKPSARKVIDTTDGNDPADVSELAALGPQVAFIGGQQCREVSARRLTRDKNPIGPPSSLRDVLLDPGEGLGHIFDMPGMAHLGGQAIADHRRPDAVAGKHPPDRGIELAVSRHPAPAMHKEQDGIVTSAPGEKQVELVLPRVGPVPGLVGDIQFLVDLAGPACHKGGRSCLRRWLGLVCRRLVRFVCGLGSEHGGDGEVIGGGPPLASRVVDSRGIHPPVARRTNPVNPRPLRLADIKARESPLVGTAGGESNPEGIDHG